MRRPARPTAVVSAAIALVGLLTVIPSRNAAFTDTAANASNSLTAAASFGMTLYLHNNPTPPIGNTGSQDLLPLDTTAPTATTLYNYDTDRDAFAGRLLARSSGLGETDPTKFQRWRHTPAADLILFGPTRLNIWSAMKDFQSGKNASLEAGLYDCTAADTECMLIDSATTTGNPWPSTWQEIVIDFGTLNHTITTGRSRHQGRRHTHLPRKPLDRLRHNHQRARNRLGGLVS